ncbi:MAG TPA: sugar ABC transporter substrate-binding protein [Burkholderiales bacterium]|nr:sugar ABC transporter substrate-binding protein [Burkholderiales bacterium]
MSPRLSIAAAAIVAATVSGAVHADGEKIAVFTKNQTNPFFQAVRLGADNAAKQMNATVLHYVPTKPDSIPEQMSQIEDVVVKKPDAIVFTPVDYKAMTPGVARINNANIPVVNITDRSEKGNFVTFIGAKDYQLGLQTGRYLLKALGGKGNIVILEGVRGVITNADRMRGFNDALKEFPNAKLLASQPGNYQRLQALQVMENLMQSYSQIDGVMAANDAMAVGAIEALEGAKRTALVIGINGTKEAVDAIKAGKLLATGDYHAYDQGCLSVMAALRYLHKQPVPKEILLPVSVIDRSNYQPYDIAPDQRSCPKWDEVVK